MNECPDLNTPSLLGRLAPRRTAQPAIVGIDDHPRRDTGPPPTAPTRRILPLVNGWLH